MSMRRTGAAGLLLLGAAGCAETTVTALPAYSLANGARVQDVVTIAADPGGGAPVITALTTYDVSAPGRVAVIARDAASGPGPGQALAAGAGRSVGTLGAALILEGDGDGTSVTSSITTTGNTVNGDGDAGDVDAVTVVCPGGDPVCTPSN